MSFQHICCGVIFVDNLLIGKVFSTIIFLEILSGILVSYRLISKIVFKNVFF